MTQAMISNVVQLVNEGDTRFDVEYQPKQRLQIDPGQSMLVNEEVAWYFLGAWWTNNDNPRMRHRADEYNRLRTLYGAYEDDRIWETNRPRLVAYSATGSRITTVVDDPEGLEGTPQTHLGREMTLEAQVANLQDMLLAMQAQLAANQVSNANAAQPAAATDTHIVAAPPGPPVPGPRTTDVAGVPVPVAPPQIDVPDEEPFDPAFGQRLEPKVQVIDTGEQAVEEDAPASIAHGPSPTGGRIPA